MHSNFQFNLSLLFQVCIWLLCTILISNCDLPSKSTQAIDKRPNILFIISDDLTAEVLGAYGNKQCLTPNIDRLADSGVRFTHAYSQFPVCGPSRAALMSGMYPASLGILSNGQSRYLDSLLGGRPTLPEYLKQNGYKTTRLSKIYHMRVPGDITAGVDGPDHPESWSKKYNFQGAEWMTEGVHEHLSNERLKFERDAHYNLGFGTAFYAVQSKHEGADQPDFQATSKAIEILSNHQNGQDDPFFLSVGYIRPHVPLVAPSSQYELYNPEALVLAAAVENDLDDVPYFGITRTSQSYGIDSVDTQQKVLQAYYASVSFMDRQVGRLLDAVEENNLGQNTIVIFTSDHGYHLGEHDLWQKLSLHEESTRIPLIIAGPGIQPSTSKSIVEQIDIYPTLAEMASLEVPQHVQGRSLQSVIVNPTTKVKEAAMSVTKRGTMIRTSDWAYIRYKDESEELYDMNRDRHQFVNLAKNESYKKEKEKMKGLLRNKQVF